MTLKEKILKKDTSCKCLNCKYYERLEAYQKPSYCNATDKLILEMHIDVVRQCEKFELKGDVK